jgi:O-antigen/teichoic acid export membrane protein
MSTLTRRIASALAASAFGQLVNVGTQILLTPFYFLHWGAERYGEWLLLSGIPSYIAMADAGIGSAAGNELTVRVGAGDIEGAQRTFRGALIVASGAGVIAMMLGTIVAFVIKNTSMLKLTLLEGWPAAKILMVLSVYVALNFLGGVSYNGFKCCGRNALGLTLTNLARLTEAIVIGSLLVFGQSPMVVAFGMLMTKVLGISVQFLVLHRVSAWLFKPPVPADTAALVKRLIAPAVAFLAFPMSNALLIQGPLLILGSTVGGAAVAVFAAFRTMSRIPLQFTNVLNSSVWPEVSLAYGARNMPLLRKIHSSTISAAIYGALVISAFMLIFGPFIMHHWLRGQVSYDRLLMSGLLLSTVLSAIWNGSSIVLSATNRHVGYSAMLMIVSLLSVLLSYPASAFLQLYGIVLVMILTELYMALFVMRQSLAVCDETPLGLLAAVFRAPKHVAEAVKGRLAHGLR